MRKIATGAVALLVLVAACSGPSEANDTACRLFADVQNDMQTAVNLWVSDGKPSGGSDSARQIGREVPGRVQEAADRATGDVAVELSNAARLAALAYPSGPDDAGVAYILQANRVIEACREAGVTLQMVERVSD